MSVIFINYRRDDSAIAAYWIYERLCQQFGVDNVFMDLKIDLGEDFVESINRAIGLCKVLIAVIGQEWTPILQERASTPNDYVRLEISAALQNKVRILPVLSPGATMPTVDQLPEDIAQLARLNALALSPMRLKDDMERLLQAVERGISAPPTVPVQPNVSSIAGLWRRDTPPVGDTIFFKQVGNKAVAFYEYSGKPKVGVYQGVLEGNVYQYQWRWLEMMKISGGGRLTIQQDRKLITGYWYNNDDPGGMIPTGLKYLSAHMPAWLSEADFEPYREFLEG